MTEARLVTREQLAAALPEEVKDRVQFVWDALRPDYSRSRHSHSDDVSCSDAGQAGHPSWPSAAAPAEGLRERAFVADMGEGVCPHGMSAHGPDGCIHCDCKTPGLYGTLARHESEAGT